MKITSNHLEKLKAAKGTATKSDYNRAAKAAKVLDLIFAK